MPTTPTTRRLKGPTYKETTSSILIQDQYVQLNNKECRCVCVMSLKIISQYFHSFFRPIFEIEMFLSLQYNIQYPSPAAWCSSYLNVDPRPQEMTHFLQDLFL